MTPVLGVALVAVPALVAATVPLPIIEGDLEAVDGLGPWLESALRSTESFGSWPGGPWRIQVHETEASFEHATRSPSGRHALWIGSTLHLRPWLKLQRRDLGALLRHELTHRRLVNAGFPRWKEEALCLWAEGHTAPPDPWPPEPDDFSQKQLDTALRAGTTASQRWAYTWLRAWLAGSRPPARPSSNPDPRISGWKPETTGSSPPP